MDELKEGTIKVNGSEIGIEQVSERCCSYIYGSINYRVFIIHILCYFEDFKICIFLALLASVCVQLYKRHFPTSYMADPPRFKSLI